MAAFHLHVRPRTTRRRGFTLVELLVVVGIISVLVGALLPALSRAREMGMRATCASQLRQNGIAILMYCDDNKGWLPLSDWRTPTLLRFSNGPYPGYEDYYVDGKLFFKRYGMSFRSLTCPSGSWVAKYWAPWNEIAPLAINYYYNGGVGDWPGVTGSTQAWYGYWYDYGGLFQYSPSLTDRPIPRRQMIKDQRESALMTDVYVPQGNRWYVGGAEFPTVLAVQAGPVSGNPDPTNPWLPGSHLKPGQGLLRRAERADRRLFGRVVQARVLRRFARARRPPAATVRALLQQRLLVTNADDDEQKKQMRTGPASRWWSSL
jgi:prepilin-type N-terminal cleavage/methylation domain-containing protein